jgi:two-component system, NtrC family, sensor histidine kinase HydH
MPSGRVNKIFSLSVVVPIILAGAIIFSLLFYSFWQQLNHKVEVILRDQFNQQQLMLARKIADNVESYFDFLENALLGYAGLFQNTSPESQGIRAALRERFDRHQHFGVVELRRYNADGVLLEAISSTKQVSPLGLKLPPPFQTWVKNPANRGQLFLSKTFVGDAPPWQGRILMRFITPLYWPGNTPGFAGSLELLIDPFFIAQKVTADVRSGQTGYAWIIDQNLIMLAHYEKDFIGHNAMQIRLSRNPQIIFRGLNELHDRLLAGQEGVTEYDSGWHRQKLGQMPKLAAFTPVRFQKGLIQGVTQVEDPAHNMWGVCVVAPAEEVSGNVAQLLHQEMFLVGLFFLLMILAGGGLTLAALIFNRELTRQVEIKTQELLESQERLLRSERFAAVGEAAAYVSHEIKNPLMVIGGMASQVARRLLQDPSAQEKLRIIQTEVKRLESFLGELRDFLRPALPVRQEISLNQVIKDVEALMGDAIEEKGVRLETRLDQDLPPTEADPNQIEQVLLNLVKNALEATEDQGKILVSSGSRDGQVWFAVQDTGKGMGEDVLEKIFHPFYTTKDKGTGLGLAVINKIITDHHGTISVDSAAGRGSTFTVRLPQKGADAA